MACCGSFMQLVAAFRLCVLICVLLYDSVKTHVDNLIRLNQF